MKKIILTAIAVASLSGLSMAQSSDYNELMTWLIAYNNNDKDAAYASLEGINAEIQKQFPMDQALRDAVNAAAAKQTADMQALAAKLGYTNYKELFGKPLDKATQDAVDKINSDYATNTAVVNMNSYYAELGKRYQAAAVEAIKRIQENAKAMK